MTINVLYFVISSVLLIRLGEKRRAARARGRGAPIAPLIAIILLGEVLPKLVAARATLAWSRFIAVPMMIVHRVITPLRLICSVAIVGPLARLIAPTAAPPTLSHDELDSCSSRASARACSTPASSRSSSRSSSSAGSRSATS